MKSAGNSVVLARLLFSISIFLQTLQAQTDTFEVASPAVWTNNDSLNDNSKEFSKDFVLYIVSSDFRLQRAVLLSKSSTYSFENLSYSSVSQQQEFTNYSFSFACGFYSNDSTKNAFSFGVFLTITDELGHLVEGGGELVWSSNRDYLVMENATLEFTKDGDLVLYDFDGTRVWNTGTSGKSVVGMSLSELGNLVLFDSNNTTIWQSFDHHTDTLVLGQTLSDGQRLTANISTTSAAPGLYYLTLVNGVPTAFYGHDPIIYYYGNTSQGELSNNKWLPFNLSLKNPPQLIRFESDGVLTLHELINVSGRGIWNLTDIFSLDYHEYPLTCGEYGISSMGQCTCPDEKNGTVFFRMINNQEPNLGCSLVTPISCKETRHHKLIALSDVSYFDYLNYSYNTDEKSCKDACLSDCYCKAAFYYQGIYYNGFESILSGSCYTTSEILSLNVSGYDVNQQVSVYLKVQIAFNSHGFSMKLIFGLAFGGLILLIFIVGFIVHYVMKKKKKRLEEDENLMPHLPGMPTRFSFAELKLTTKNFSKKLGGGGFGSVFLGNIGDKEVAVKRLDGIGQGKEEFLAEVRTIGSIHHINLVRLIGYCAEKSERLLIYEYMPNGSLDQWIYDKGKNFRLGWSTRLKIIEDVAKGLLYLHKDCRQTIAHLDVKPQNILLDDNFNAKVSDFGLAKLIDREQSHVITRMRGTPGYLAPEWLTYVITEKADVYSFGVVIIEIICGRKNLDYTQPEEEQHLINMLQRSAENNNLIDLIDEQSTDMHLNLERVLKMMKLAIWCLQSDHIRRPSMSMVLKVLEGGIGIENDLDYNFFYPTPEVPSQISAIYIESGYQQSATNLSGPR